MPLKLKVTTIRWSIGIFTRLIGSTFAFSQMNPLRDCHLRTHQILKGHTRVFVRAYYLGPNNVGLSHVAIGRTTCHNGTKTARPSIAPSSEPQWGLTRIEPLRPYYLSSGRRSRSDGRKLFIPSTSRTLAARRGEPSTNLLASRSGRSFRLWPVSANSIASQLVKNGAHRTGDRESTRLVNKQLSNQWKIPTPEGEPFRPEELAAALRRLKPGKSPGLDSIFPEFMLHTGLALKSWFCDFLTSCMRQLKIPKIWRRALIVSIPKPENPLGTQRATVSCLCCVPLLKSSRNSYILVSIQSSTLAPTRAGGRSTREVGRRAGPQWRF